MPQNLTDEPQTGRPRRQGVRPDDPLTQDEIVAAAMRLIDERGAEAFSMRVLAKDLGVYPTAIYWHVGDRSQLLGLVSAAWMRDVLPSAEGLDWREWLRAMAHGYRDAARRHPNIARLTASELINDPVVFQLPEEITSRLLESGLPTDELVHAYNTVVGATVGFVDLEFARDPLRTDEELDRVEQQIRSLDAAHYPTLARVLPQFADHAFSMRWTPAGQNPLDESFEYLAELLLDGLMARAGR